MPMLNGRMLANRNAFFPGFPGFTRVLDQILPGNEFAAAPFCVDGTFIFFCNKSIERVFSQV
jgi:hypothetical protein